ncbi:hypothetical protein VE00_00872 [Pseudogymnoascus sp. WSF 3629]|nr:hypothetical protein VE00_00872 [Pseudogymnoascus sp. WSF 3629]
MPSQLPVGPLDQFLLFGDSITEKSNDQEHGFAFASALQNAYMLKLDVINRGFGGYNTNNAVEILPAILPAPSQARVRFLAIFFGANDSNLGPPLLDTQYVSIPDFTQNLRDLISHPLIAAHNPPPRIILIAPPPIEETFIAGEDVKNGYTEVKRYNRNTALYAEAVTKVGKETGTPVVDLWSVFMAKAGWVGGYHEDVVPMPGSIAAGFSDVLKSLLDDGLHLTPAGYKIMFEEVLKVIGENWPDQTPEALKSLRDLNGLKFWYEME